MTSKQSSPSQQQQQESQSRVHEMQINRFFTDEEPSSSTTLWDWDQLLDFTADESIITSPFDSDHQNHYNLLSTIPSPVVMEDPLLESSITSSQNSDRVRKRDPRLTCVNFLAGRSPCACPEMDAKLAEEEEEEREAERGKKKAKTVRAPTGTARCQVPGCEVDIRELKGYHRRHRVCLKCVNATEVLIHDESKRYCQQCGKFHVLPDFDEGKRSCRRKLERHNNRRRRKCIDNKGSGEHEAQEDTVNNIFSCDGEVEKDKLCSSYPIAEKDSLLEYEDGRVSALCSVPSPQIMQGDSVISSIPSDETQFNGGKDDLKNTLSTSYSDNKSVYSSTCQTGRISFKLYDWNPAEFPRRLRHQIFQWLSSMPVELEGYIRPGCTILTAFVAMPKIMWVKLLEHPASYLHDFVVAPGSLLSGKGRVLIYINDTMFHVVNDRISVTKVKQEAKAPRIHYVHPMCFEAGQPMEFVACGSNLSQPKFRFLVSFSGKYLENECCVSLPHGISDQGFGCNIQHQLCKIQVPSTQSNLSGPAFVEVENESGFSNFVPILIADKEACSEMKKIQQTFDASLINSKGTHFAPNSCEVSTSRQASLSDFVSDIAWLLKEPTSDIILNTSVASQIERYNCLLNFLILHDSTIILGKVIRALKTLMDRAKDINPCTYGIDLNLFENNVNHAKDILNKKLRRDSVCFNKDGNPHVVPISNQNRDASSDSKLTTGSSSFDSDENHALLNRDIILTVSHMKELPTHSVSRIFSNTNRPTAIVVVFAVICFGICTILLHPHNASKFVVSIRRLCI